MGQPPDDLDIATESFMENPLVVIAPPDHPFVRRSSDSRKKAGAGNISGAGAGFRYAQRDGAFFFGTSYFHINRGMETDTNEAIKQAVQAGMGLGIMSLHTAELELETKRLKILDVQDFPIMRHWHVVHRKNKRLSSAAQAFREFLLTEARQLMPPVAFAKS